MGTYKFSEKENYLQLEKTLPEGYYVAKVKSSKGTEIFNCPIQINDISAYAIETERDVLVWVAKGTELAKNVKVEYLGKETKTDSNGIAKFKNIANNSATIEYLKIENKLVVGIYNYKLDNYPTGYIYTDRPLYKNTDTIRIWGFIPRKLFYDNIEDEFYIEFNNEGKQKISVDAEGNINYKIELSNYTDIDDASICLYYKDKEIAYRSVIIENYELQNYTYEAIMDKNYVYLGDKFRFSVKVEHITGLIVPNKTVAVMCDEKTYREVTDENGIAHFEIKMELGTEFNKEEETEAKIKTITICNGDDKEYTNAEKEEIVYLLTRDTYSKFEDEDNKIYKMTLYKLSNNKNVNVDYELNEIYDGVYDTKVQVSLIEQKYEKQITKWRYNEYTKQEEVAEYHYEMTEENHEVVKEISTKNGKIEFDANKLELKKGNDDEYYDYLLEFSYTDPKGRIVKEKQYLYYPRYEVNVGTSWEPLSEPSDLLLDEIDTSGYYAYRYFLKTDKEKFVIGDTADFNLVEDTKNGVKQIQNKGKILQIVLQEDITETNIIGDNEIKYTFEDKDFPGCKVGGAYFYNGKFYRMPMYYFDFNEEDKKVDIEITSDKEEYKPGEEVTLTIKTTNKGNPIKSSVNVSVVNKAIFEIIEDDKFILEDIYRDKDYPVYTYSTYRDDIIGNGFGMGGGGDDYRFNFGDTAYFETVSTNAQGIATVKFTLPDNVTTYTVTAHSANKDLYLGVNTKDIVSTLDFFIQYTEPRNVKTTDDLVLNATSISEGKYDVEYEFTIKELNKTLTTKGTTNTIATVNFGKLPYGTYTLIIKGKNSTQEDSVQYKFNIVESSQEVKDKKTININKEATIKPSKNPIVLEIYNKDMEKYLKYIDFIEGTLTERLDTQIAYNKVQGIKNQYYSENNPVNHINIFDYEGDVYFKNLKNSKEDIVLTALINKYAKEYYGKTSLMYNQDIQKDDNIFEIYLLASAKGEPVLNDLLYLKDEKDISNYNKLLLVVSLEFLGDYQNARELYSMIEFTKEEQEQYKSIIALAETFVNKEQAIIKIDELIESSPADEYLRFAILSFFENNAEDISKQDTIEFINKDKREKIQINGMQVKTLILNNEELSEIKFETNSEDLIVSYYYQTLLENIESKNISKDIGIRIEGKLKQNNIVNLVVEFNNDFEGEVKIALPNSIRLAKIYTDYDYYNKYYLINNQIDYAVFFKKANCSKMKIPLVVTTSGEYKFENIVSYKNGMYHISNSLDLNIEK